MIKYDVYGPNICMYIKTFDFQRLIGNGMHQHHLKNIVFMERNQNFSPVKDICVFMLIII